MTVQQRRQLETAVLRALADDDGNEILASTMGVFRAVNPDGPGLVWSYGRVRDCLRSPAARPTVPL
jgi:hypothetical protein